VENRLSEQIKEIKAPHKENYKDVNKLTEIKKQMDKGVLQFVRLKAANNIYRTYKLPQLTTAQSEGQQQSLMESNKQFIEKYLEKKSNEAKARTERLFGATRKAIAAGGGGLKGSGIPTRTTAAAPAPSPATVARKPSPVVAAAPAAAPVVAPAKTGGFVISAKPQASKQIGAGGAGVQPVLSTRPPPGHELKQASPIPFGQLSPQLRYESPQAGTRLSLGASPAGSERKGSVAPIRPTSVGKAATDPEAAAAHRAMSRAARDTAATIPVDLAEITAAVEAFESILSGKSNEDKFTAQEIETLKQHNKLFPKGAVTGGSTVRTIQHKLDLLKLQQRVGNLKSPHKGVVNSEGRFISADRLTRSPAKNDA
jgi:hypothetical protein